MAARIALWWCLTTVTAAREWAVSDRFTGPVEHKPGDVSLGFRIPRNNSETLPTVEPEIDLWVDDHAAFLGVPSCCGVFTSSIRLVSISQ